MTIEANAALDLAVAAAREAGTLLLELARNPATGVRSKSSATDLVSAADERAEAVIVSRIRAARPDDAIVAEEGSTVAGTSGVRWYVDPLDGTTNYLYGAPHWCVTICCADATGSLAGVVYDPLRGELFTAVRHGGSWLSGVKLAVTDQRRVDAALVATGFSYDSRERERQSVAMAGLLPKVRDIRRAGSAALDLAWVAAGRLDAYYESGVMSWDIAAGVLLVREAGGVVTDLERVGADHRPGVLASNAHVHNRLREIVSG